VIETLANFVDRLRARGLAVSPAEAIEAARALAALGVESRPGAESALLLTLAKDRRARAVVREEFLRFFVAPPRRGTAKDGEGAPGESGAGRGAPGLSASAPLRRQPQEPGRKATPLRREPLARRGQARKESRAEPLVERLRRAAGPRQGRLRRLVLARRGPDPRLHGPGEPIGRVDLKARLDPAVEARLLEETARLVAELRLRRGRRRMASRDGLLSLRRTLRASLRTGGVPFMIARSERRRRRPRVVVLLDVSRSCERAAGLFVALASRLLESEATVRVFAFVDAPVECTRELAASEAALRQALPSLPGLNLDAPSDYGRALFALGAHPALGGAGTDRILVVLGDGRTNRFDPMGWAFEDLVRRCRAAIWLVPERRDEWGSGDSALGEYLPRVDVAVEAFNLEGLVAGVRRLLAEVRR